MGAWAAASGSDPVQKALAAPNVIQAKKELETALTGGITPENREILVALVTLERLRGNEGAALEWVKKCGQACHPWPESAEAKIIRAWACGEKKIGAPACQ